MTLLAKKNSSNSIYLKKTTVIIKILTTYLIKQSKTSHNQTNNRAKNLNSFLSFQTLLKIRKYSNHNLNNRLNRNKYKKQVNQLKINNKIYLNKFRKKYLNKKKNKKIISIFLVASNLKITINRTKTLIKQWNIKILLQTKNKLLISMLFSGLK